MCVDYTCHVEWHDIWPVESGRGTEACSDVHWELPPTRGPHNFTWPSIHPHQHLSHTPLVLRNCSALQGALYRTRSEGERVINVTIDP